MMRSNPERKRSAWKRYAEWSLSLGRFSSATALAMELMSFRCVVYVGPGLVIIWTEGENTLQSTP
jgi:hypothetical protein